MTDEKKQPEPEDFGLVTARDEAQIMAELAGVPVLDFVYFNKRGQAELTYAGTKWAVRELANRGEAIRLIADPKVERCPIDPEYICVTIRSARYKVDREAKCETMLDTGVGAARNWKSMKLTEGKIIPDEHFFKKAVGIASRNAMQSLIPQDFLAEMVEKLAVQRRKLERGEKETPAKPAKQEAAKPAKEAKPEQAATPPPAQQQAATPPPAEPAKPADQKAATPGKPGEKTIRQKLFVALNHFEPNTEAKRKLLAELTGKSSSSELEDTVVTRLTSALDRALPGKVNELRVGGDGTRYILEKPTGNVLFGKYAPAPQQGAATATAPAASGAEEEPF